MRLAQFMAGMWAYRARDSVATALHGTWGSFWFGSGLLQLPLATHVLTTGGTLDHALSRTARRFSRCPTGIRRAVRHLRAWALAWVALFWLWMLLAGEWNAYEWVAAAAAATVAATLGELARTHTKVSARLPFDRLGDVGSAMSTVFVDFGLLMWALVRSLVRREIVRGVFRARTFPVGGDDAASVGFRAWVGVLATYSPNAYVVDLEPERQLVLVHDLVPFRRSEDPA